MWLEVGDGEDGGRRERRQGEEESDLELKMMGDLLAVVVRIRPCDGYEAFSLESEGQL